MGIFYAYDLISLTSPCYTLGFNPRNLVLQHLSQNDSIKYEKMLNFIVLSKIHVLGIYRATPVSTVIMQLRMAVLSK